MSNHNFKFRDFDATVTLDRGHESVTASIDVSFKGEQFGNFEPKRFSGFCDSEMVYDMLHTSLATRQQIEPVDIWEEVAEVLGECECG